MQGNWGWDEINNGELKVTGWCGILPSVLKENGDGVHRVEVELRLNRKSANGS
jgi:hypothetical protein